MITKTLIGTVVVVAACGLSATASAGFTNEDFASWHGSENSTYNSWETFSDATGAPNWSDQGGFAASVHNVGAPGTATISGAGNIYGFGGGLNIHTYVHALDDVQQVQFNISSGGTPFNWADVALVYTTTDGGSGYLPNFGWNINHEVEDGWGGYLMNVSYSWDLSSIAGNIDAIGIFAESSEAHTSLDAVSIDVLGAVPAPGAIALLGLAGLAGRRRRRN